MKKIALEEHVLTPGMEEYWAPTVADVPAAARERLHTLLTDFGERRLAAMDEAGIEHAILSLSGPGVQVERNTGLATSRARAANDDLAARIAARPDRFSGFAHLALQDAAGAAAELERCVREHGFKGALINGHTNGLYLDHPSLAPLWECAESLGVPLYLHPGDPVAPMPVLDGHKGLRRATWEWTVETGSHALRIIFGGVFDRYPRAILALGHLGETLPYLLWRLDSRAKLYGLPLARSPSETIRSNVVVTLSGMFSREPLICALDALGPDRVMFSADYPFESAPEAGAFMDAVPLAQDVREAVAWRNAARVFGLA